MAGQKVLAEHLAGHLGYLDASYRQVSSEQAGVEYSKVQDVVTIGVPMEYKEVAKEQDKKLQMQSESIEGLRAINDRLQTQMQAMQEKNATLNDRLHQIEQKISTIKTLKKIEGSLKPEDHEAIAKIVVALQKK